MDVGAQIMQLRKDAGLTQQQLAERCYVTRQTVASWEKGRTLPDIQSVVYLARTFGVSVDELVGAPELAELPRVSAERREMLVLCIVYCSLLVFEAILQLLVIIDSSTSLFILWALIILAFGACGSRIFVLCRRYGIETFIFDSTELSVFILGLSGPDELPGGLKGFVLRHWYAIVAIVLGTFILCTGLSYVYH